MHSDDQSGLLTALVVALLRAHGYIGAATRAALGVGELGTALQQFI